MCGRSGYVDRGPAAKLTAAAAISGGKQEGHGEERSGDLSLVSVRCASGA